MITTDIVCGPSRQQLMESFTRHCSGAQTQVRFLTKDGLNFVGSINSLTYEDDSGFSFLFKGYFNGNQHLKGYFHTKTRKGWIEVKPLDKNPTENSQK